MAEPDILSITKPIKLIYTKEINGLWHANLDIEKNDYIQEECYVEFEGILFIAKKINEIKGKGLISRIKLDHLMAELNDSGIGPFEYNGITCEAALTNVLSGTNWSVGTVDIEGTGDIKSDKRITVLAAINLIAKEFDGEIDFRTTKQQDGSFSRIVDLKQQIGTATKLQIRYDKNSDYIEREKDTTKLITRLYIYGRDDITIESVNPTGKPYLDSPNIDKYKNIKEGPPLYTNISDKTILMNYGQAYLNLYDTPILRYKINTWDATIIPKWADEVINLGDTSRVYDSDLKINVDVRNKKLIKDLTDPRYQKIELANKFKSIVEPISNIEQAVKNITFQNDYRALDIRDVTFPKDISTGLPVTWTLYVGGVLEVGDYQGPIVHVDRACTAYELWAYCAWKPTVSDVTIRVNRNGISLGDVTIPFGDYVAPGEGEVGAGAALPISETPMSYGDYLNIDVKAADGIAQRVTVEVRCR